MIVMIMFAKTCLEKLDLSKNCLNFIFETYSLQRIFNFAIVLPM